MAQPLNEITSEGKRLTRDPKIESAIDLALSQDLDTLRRRAAISDPGSTDFLPSECLVHLIRDSIKKSNSSNPVVATALIGVLLKRCEANLKNKVSSQISTAENLREEIISKFGLLFVEDRLPENSTNLDFFEVRFNSAFAYFRIDAVRSELARLNHLVGPEKYEDDNDHTFAEGNINQIVDTSFDVTAFEDCLDDKKNRAWLRTAINELPELQRKALLLSLNGYKIESIDPNETTIASICKVSGRTVRNWLSQATAELIKSKEAA